MTTYVCEPDGTICYDPTPEDYERIKEEERELVGQD